MPYEKDILKMGDLTLTHARAVQPVLFETRRQSAFKSLIRWAIDVDPIAI